MSWRKAQRLNTIVRLVGPHPLLLARTFAFLGTRSLRQRRLRRLYSAPLEAAEVSLRLPAVDLGRYDDLPEELRAAAASLRREADAVLAHRVDILGSGLVSLGPTIDWHRDFKSGYVWPCRFYREVEATRLDDDSDAKVPWELSRCHHLLTLARAAAIFEEPSYAEELSAQLASWLDENPPGVGINWVNPMEVGIRAANLVWAVATLEPSQPLEADIRGRLVDSLRWHGRHIRANLEGTPYLRSNHYLGDLLGLLVLGATLSGDPEAQRWLRFSCRELEREIRTQVYPDGVSFEGSLPYHGLALEMFLLAAHVARWAGRPLSAAFEERLTAMVDVCRNARHPNGRVPLFGDQDSGRILPAGFARPASHDHLLSWAVEVVRSRRTASLDIDPEVALVFGVSAWERAHERPVAEPSASRAYRDGGIYVLHTPGAHLVLRCGGVGQNGSGGHSHNDVFSYELTFGDVLFVIDSGTFAYTFDVTARNEFRSTAAHNVVQIDDAEIHPIDPARVFELAQFARISVDTCDLEGSVLTVAGSHDGYRRLDDPVEVRRRVSIDSASGAVEIRDELGGRATHGVKSFIHLAPETRVRRAGRLSFELVAHDQTATCWFDGVAEEELSVREAWVSDRYGVRRTAPVLAVEAQRPLPASIGYRFVPGAAVASPASD